MEVRVFATLRPIVGGATVSVATQPGDSVRSLLDEMIDRWPALRKELFDAEGRLHNNIHVFVNGRDVRYLDGLDMPIPPGANIRIFPPVGGGCPRYRGGCPRYRGGSPKHRGGSPKHRGGSPKHRGGSPKHRGG